MPKPDRSAIVDVSFTDADKASSMLSTAYAPVCLEPLAGKAFDIRISGVALPGMQIYRTSSESGARFTSVGHFDGYTFSSMHIGRAEVSSGTKNLGIGDGSALAIDATEVDALLLSGLSLFHGVALEANQLNKALGERLGYEPSLRVAFEEHDISAELQASYQGICDVIVTGFHEKQALIANPLAQMNLLDAIINLVLSGTRHNYSEALLRGTVELPRVLRRAVEYMHANAHRPITTTDIALDLGISLRSLQLSFQKWFNVTPNQHLRGIRLNLARENLTRHPGLKIGDIARKWGFNSPGEFARLYQAEFGEMPRETKAR